MWTLAKFFTFHCFMMKTNMVISAYISCSFSKHLMQLDKMWRYWRHFHLSEGLLFPTFLMYSTSIDTASGSFTEMLKCKLQQVWFRISCRSPPSLDHLQNSAEYPWKNCTVSNCRHGCSETCLNFCLMQNCKTLKAHVSRRLVQGHWLLSLYFQVLGCSHS